MNAYPDDLLVDDELDKEIIFVGVVCGAVLGILLGVAAVAGVVIFGGD